MYTYLISSVAMFSTCVSRLYVDFLSAVLLSPPLLQSGSLHYFHMEEWATVNEFHHPVSIVGVYPDAAGIRVVFVDDKGDALLYNPVQDACVELPNFPQGTKGILWDSWVSDRVSQTGCVVSVQWVGHLQITSLKEDNCVSTRECIAVGLFLCTPSHEEWIL